MTNEGRANDTGFLAWITRLVREHRDGLVSAARHEGLSAEDALDAVQEAFTAFLDLPHSRQLAFETEDARQLLSVLVRNYARNRRRRHDRARPHHTEPALLEAIPHDDDGVEALILEAEAHVLAFGCVERLGQVQRLVVNLRLLENRPGAHVADLLGTTPGNVAVILHRAKRALRECLAG